MKTKTKIGNKKMNENTMKMKPTELYRDMVVNVVNDVKKIVGEETFHQLLEIDGLPIMLIKLIFGNLSSSSVLEIYTDRYGFKDCENDLEWLKSLEVK